MPLVLKKRDTFTIEVTVRQPRDSGQLEEHKFLALFRHRSADEVKDILRKPRTDSEMLTAEWQGWPEKSGLKTMAKQDGGAEVEVDLPYTPENRIAVLAEPGVEQALVKAWLYAMVHGPAKN